MRGMEISKANCEDLIQYFELEGEEAAPFLRGKGAFINNCDENDGIGPIHVVSAVGAENILNLLLLRGADVDKNTSIGWTSVMYAARNGHPKCVQQLIECGADIHHRNKLGVGVLSMAAVSGNTKIIEIVSHSMQNNMLSDDVISALQVAALRGQSIVLQLLLSSHSHLINACDKYGITPLMLAVAGGHEEAIKILLDSGADAGLQNSHQFTALDIASAKGLKNVIYLLKDKTEKRDDQSCKKRQSLDVGSDLVEQYGWSSIFTPKLQRGTWYHNSREENLLISPAHQILSANSNVSFQAIEDNTDVSSLFIPVHLPICNQSPVVPVDTSVKNNVLIDTDSTHVPVPPVSPYSCSFPFNFPKTIPEKKYHSVSSLNCNCPNEVQSELKYPLMNELCCKNDPLKPVAHRSPVQENCNRIQPQAKKGSRGMFWKTGKIEKWLHTVLTSLQKNTKVKNNSPYNQKNTLGPSRSSQCCVNINTENMLFEFQKNSNNYTNNKNAVPSSASSELKNLLVNLELQTYIPLFVEHEVDMDSFLMLRQEDLEEIGITSPKSQNKLLKIIMTFKGES